MQVNSMILEDEMEYPEFGKRKTKKKTSNSPHSPRIPDACPQCRRLHKKCWTDCPGRIARDSMLEQRHEEAPNSLVEVINSEQLAVETLSQMMIRRYYLENVSLVQ